MELKIYEKEEKDDVVVLKMERDGEESNADVDIKANDLLVAWFNPRTKEVTVDKENLESLGFKWRLHDGTKNL